MKTLEQLTKKQLIKLITEIRPKADAYDRVCQELGIENNIIGEFKKLNISNISDSYGYVQLNVINSIGVELLETYTERTYTDGKKIKLNYKIVPLSHEPRS